SRTGRRAAEEALVHLAILVVVDAIAALAASGGREDVADLLGAEHAIVDRHFIQTSDQRLFEAEVAARGVLILSQNQHAARAERQRSRDGNRDALRDLIARFGDQWSAHGFTIEIELSPRAAPGQGHEVPGAVRDAVAIDVDG